MNLIDMALKNKTIRIIYKTLLETFHIGKENYLDMIDLSKVPEKELRDHYVDYRFFARKTSFCNMFVPVAEGYAVSSSDKTEDPDSVVSALIDKYGFSKKWQVSKVLRSNNISVLTVVADIEENLQMVSDDMDKAGYFVGFRKVVNIKGMQWQIVQFEPMFEFDQTVVVSRLLEGEYFQIDKMISSDYNTKITINKKELQGCIERASLLIRESERKPIIINVTDGSMEMKIQSAMGSMNEDIDISKEGRDIMIGFNPKFILDALRVIDDEEITMYLVNPKAPFIIKNDEQSYIYLVLPISFNM